MARKVVVSLNGNSNSIQNGLNHLDQGPFIVEGRILNPEPNIPPNSLVTIYDSKIHPEWDDKDAIVMALKSISGSILYLVTILNNGNQFEFGYVEIGSVIEWKFMRKSFVSKVEAFRYQFFIFGMQNKIDFCGYCGIPKAEETPLYLCKGCQYKEIKNEYQIRYCSKKCQKKDWKNRHRNICGRKNRVSKDKVRQSNDLLSVLLDP